MRFLYLVFFNISLLMVSSYSLGSSILAGSSDKDNEDDDLTSYYLDTKPVGNIYLSPLLSLIVPGAGQIYNGRVSRGIGYISFSLSLYVALANIPETDISHSLNDAIKAKNNASDTDIDYIDYNNFTRNTMNYLIFNTHLYSAFDAYRYAVLSRKNYYDYRKLVSKESLVDLSLAPFNVDYLFDPYVLIPLATSALFLIGSNQIDDPHSDKNTSLFRSPNLNQSTMFVGSAIKNEFVAVGEEAFFRGVVNTEAVNQFGPIGGVLTSSVVFGLSHNGEGFSANKGVATIYGLYLGSLHVIKGGQLGYGVALHYWWNMAVAMSMIRNSKEFSLPLANIRF